MSRHKSPLPEAFQPRPSAELMDISVMRGRQVPDSARIAVIIMSTGSDPYAIEAVESVLAQDVAAEIAVVNTGEGSLGAPLGKLGEHVILIETPHRQFAGGTRNIGIRYTTAPIVAFLAADCLLTPGWLRRQLEWHEGEGACVAVASALRPAPSINGYVPLIGWTCCAFFHFGRMPETEPVKATRFGLTYQRHLFTQYGLFDEQVRVAEDTLFNERLLSEHSPYWDPRIVTLHRYPETFVEALLDAFHRAGRHVHYQRNRGEGGRLSAFFSLYPRMGFSVIRRVIVGCKILPPEVVKGAPLVVPLTLASMIGALFPSR